MTPVRALAVLLLLSLPAPASGQTLAAAIPEQHRVLLIDGQTFDTVATVRVGPVPHEIAVPRTATGCTSGTRGRPQSPGATPSPRSI
jgi:hypothetical protein